MYTELRYLFLWRTTAINTTDPNDTLTGFILIRPYEDKKTHIDVLRRAKPIVFPNRPTHTTMRFGTQLQNSVPKSTRSVPEQLISDDQTIHF